MAYAFVALFVLIRRPSRAVRILVIAGAGAAGVEFPVVGYAALWGRSCQVPGRARMNRKPRAF
jgi:hypothetical protein